MSVWSLNSEQRNSFAIGAVRTFDLVSNAGTLYSFNSSPDRPTKPDPERPGKFAPMYWMAKSSLLGAVHSSMNRPNDVFEYIRQGVALCEDWNSLEYMFTLEVPETMPLWGWHGPAKRQPRLSPHNMWGVHTNAILTGGWEQFLIDTSGWLVHWIRGPISTGR